MNFNSYCQFDFASVMSFDLGETDCVSRAIPGRPAEEARHKTNC